MKELSICEVSSVSGAGSERPDPYLNDEPILACLEQIVYLYNNLNEEQAKWIEGAVIVLGLVVAGGLLWSESDLWS